MCLQKWKRLGYVQGRIEGHGRANWKQPMVYKLGEPPKTIFDAHLGETIALTHVTQYVCSFHSFTL